MTDPRFFNDGGTVYENCSINNCPLQFFILWKQTHTRDNMHPSLLGWLNFTFYTKKELKTLIELFG